jgi:hypothetical protein
MGEYTGFLAMISSEFHRYLMENEGTAAEVPAHSVVVFRVEGEEGFNRWHEDVSLRNCEPGQPVQYVLVKSWRRHSLIEEIEMVEAEG